MANQESITGTENTVPSEQIQSELEKKINISPDCIYTFHEPLRDNLYHEHRETMRKDGWIWGPVPVYEIPKDLKQGNLIQNGYRYALAATISENYLRLLHNASVLSKEVPVVVILPDTRINEISPLFEHRRIFDYQDFLELIKQADNKTIRVVNTNGLL